MSDLIAEPTGEAIQGTDQAAVSMTKPAVEVTFQVARTGDGRPLNAESARAARITAGIAHMQRTGATAGKAVEPAAAAAQAESAPVVVDPLATPDEEAPADAEPAAEDEPAAEGEVAAEVEAAAEPETKPDLVELAAYKAEVETAQHELALTRAQLERAQLGGVSDDDRLAWIDKPIDSLRGFIAQRLGVAPDAKEVADELAHLQRELTIEAIGPDSLPDERRHQRSTEQTDRRWRLTQTVRTASQETAKATQQRQQVVGHVASVIEAAREEFPYVALAPDLDGRSPAEVAVDLWVAAVKSGRLKSSGDAADVREALRLTNDHYKNRLAKLTARQPKTTAPPPATAPAPASPKGAAPGAPAPTKSTAPAKAGSATPKTLSAKQAAAAPIAKVAPDTKPSTPAVEEIDPHDRHARDARRLQIGRRNLTK